MTGRQNTGRHDRQAKQESMTSRQAYMTGKQAWKTGRQTGKREMDCIENSVKINRKIPLSPSVKAASSEVKGEHLPLRYLNFNHD
jgi:hypothetical protein